MPAENSALALQVRFVGTAGSEMRPCFQSFDDWSSSSPSYSMASIPGGDDGSGEGYQRFTTAP